MAPRKPCYCHCEDGDDGGGGDYPPCPGAATVTVTVPPLDRNPLWWVHPGEFSSQTLEIAVPATYDCSPGTCCAFVGDRHIGQHVTQPYDYTRCYFSLFGTDTGDPEAPWYFGLLILMCSEAATIQQANYGKLIDEEDETILGEYDLVSVYGDPSPFLNWPATITVS